MRKIARGWSANIVKTHCSECRKIKEHVIIQYQPKRAIGSLPLMGKGPRLFGKECRECHNIIDINEKERKNVVKLKYFEKRQKERMSKDEGRVRVSKRKKDKNIKIPVLTEAEREKYVKHNRKEGIWSGIMAIVIGIVIMPFWTWGGIGFALVFLMLALYLAYEDPERKYRDYYKAGKNL